MKLFLYSDLHISRTSSILPSSSDTRYTYRQQMIINTGKYLANIIDQEKPDMIINLGDTFDQHTITSYDVDVASEFFKCFRMFNIPHLVLVGNHEMVNQDFNAIKILGNINNITVISEPCSVNTNVIIPNLDNVELAFLPYCDYRDVEELPKGKFLFSHQDIQGSIIRGNFAMPNGLTNEQLKQYQLVFNGHIHKSSIVNNVVNVGSVTTHSFSDDENSVPQCYVFDTETLDLKTFKPTVCPLFRKFDIENSLDELKIYINNLDNNYKYLIHCVCPFEIKEDVKQYMEEEPKILNSRLNVKIAKTLEEEKVETVNLQSNIDITQTFKEFLESTDLKLPKEYYSNILQEV